LFEERQVGSERFNIFEGCPAAKTVTIVLRGGADQFIAESERSLHDALMIVKRALSHGSIVGGGGAIEMELSRSIRDYSKTIYSKHQLIVAAFGRSLELIPRQVAENAGFDAIDLVNQLRAYHAKGFKWYGIDIEREGVCDTVAEFVWEPTLVKQQALSAATEAACLILSVDETVTQPKSEGLNDDRPAPAPRR